MHWLWVIIIGFLAGAIAKLFIAGPGGFIVTTLLGIVGAIFASWLGQQIGWYGPGQRAGFIGAIVGAVLILAIYRAIVGAAALTSLPQSTVCSHLRNAVMFQANDYINGSGCAAEGAVAVLSLATAQNALGRQLRTTLRPRHHSGHDRRGDEALLPRLRDERDRGARAARCPRRAQTGPPPHPLLDEGERQRVEPRLPQIGAHRRRRDRQIPPAWRAGDLRRDGADGAGLCDAPAADRRPGQFRLDGRRPAGGLPLHRGAARPRRRHAARRSRQGHRRVPAELRRHRAGAQGPAGRLSEHPGQWRQRHRGRHGDQHPAAQSRRGHRRLLRLSRQPGDYDRRADAVRPGAGFSDRRDHHGARRHACRLPDRARRRRHAREDPCRRDPQGPRGDRLHRAALSGQQGEAGRAHRRDRPRETDRGHLRSARRERPRGPARRRRIEARRRARHRPQPALPPHRAADELWRQHAGAERRPAGAA